MDLMFGVAAAAAAAALAVVIFGMLPPARSYPRCGAQLPRIRKPTSTVQLLWGGWTCRAFGCEIDRSGKQISK
jgi:hypothetical protein